MPIVVAFVKNGQVMSAGSRNRGRTYVSRAGEKLQAAMEAFGLDVRGAVCADFGCNVGGFTDCLLQHGAGKVYAVDTGYGALAWTLRRDGRVVVLERTNALYAPPPEPVDLVTIDVGWTVQQLIVPAAMRWLRGDTSAGRRSRGQDHLAAEAALRAGQARRRRKPKSALSAPPGAAGVPGGLPAPRGAGLSADGRDAIGPDSARGAMRSSCCFWKAPACEESPSTLVDGKVLGVTRIAGR